MDAMLKERYQRLTLMVESLVQIELLTLRAQGGPTETDRQWCKDHADDLLEHGDVLMGAIGKKEHDQRGRTLATLARSIAVMSYMPGGITIFGQHWESGTDGGSPVD